MADDILDRAKDAGGRLHERIKHAFVDWMEGEEEADTDPAAVMLATLVGAAQMIAVAHLDCGGREDDAHAREVFRRDTVFMEEAFAQYIAFLVATGEAEEERANGRKPS